MKYTIEWFNIIFTN